MVFNESCLCKDSAAPPGGAQICFAKLKWKACFTGLYLKSKLFHGNQPNIFWDEFPHGAVQWIITTVWWHNCELLPPPPWNSGGAQDCLTSGTCWGHDYRAWLNASVTDHNKLFYNLAVMYFAHFQFWQNQLQLLHTWCLIFIQKAYYITA